MSEPIIAAIKGVATWVPETKLTNADLEKMVDTNDQWIRERTGIEERRILKGEHLGSSYMGVRAVRKLFDKTGVNPDEIELVICTTVVPDYKFPTTGALVMKETGIRNAYSFDLNGTCTGFLYALDVAKAFVVSGRYRKVLVVSAEKLSSMTNYKDRASCILFGDGASAVLIEPSDNEFGIKDTEMRTLTDGAMNIIFKGGGSVYGTTQETLDNDYHYFWQDGKAVFKQAVMGMESVCTTVMERNGLTRDDIRYLMPHQANKRIIDTIAKRMGIEDKVVINIERFGNMSTVTVPLCMEQMESSMKPGDKIILTAFGSGYTMGAAYVEWAY